MTWTRVEITQGLPAESAESENPKPGKEFNITDKPRTKGRKVEGVGAMKDKELKLEEISLLHTRCSGGRSCTGEREVERVHMLLYCQIRCTQMVAQTQGHDLGVGSAGNQWIGEEYRSVSDVSGALT